MISTIDLDLRQVAGPLALPLDSVAAVVDLLDSGNTIPFITRYRKDQTGGMDEEQVRAVQERVLKLRQLADRKQTILRSIEAQGKTTPELTAQIEAADTMKRLEDLYLPYKPKKQTLATTARGRGLEPLANEILANDPACRDLDARAADFVNPDRQIHNIGDALLGVGHILAEVISERADLRGRLRTILEETGRLVSNNVEGDGKETKEKEAAATPAETDAAAEAPKPEPPAANKKKQKGKRDGNAFRDFFDFSEALAKVPPHRVLAINRGERAKILRIKVEADTAAMHRVLDELVIEPETPHADFLRGVRARRAGAAHPAQPRTGSAPRIDRSGRDARRGSFCPQLAQAAAATAHSRMPGFGARPRFQERLQAGGTGRIRQPVRRTASYTWWAAKNAAPRQKPRSSTRCASIA